MLAEATNYCPDCVSIEVEGRADKSGHGALQFNLEKIKNIGKPKKFVPARREPLAYECILLSICFSQQEERIFGGNLVFGLRKAKLEFYLTGAEMHIKHRYGKELSAVETIEVTTELQSERQGGAKISVKDILASEATILSKNSEKKAYKEIQLLYKIKAVGHSHSPAWFFEEPDRQKMLDGMIKELQIGTLTLYDPDWNLSFSLTFKIDDIYLCGSGGIWMQDISKNKLAIIERKLAKTLLSKRIVSPICEGCLSP